MIKKLLLPVATGFWCAAALALCAVSAQAATTNVVNDTWKDATRTDPVQPGYSENGTDVDADGDIESAWYRGGTSSSTTMSTNHMVHTAGAGQSMSLTTYFKTNTQAITLNNTGDSLKLTWVFKPNGLNTNATGNNDMRIALVDSPGRVTSDASPGSAVYSGYGIGMNMRAGTFGANNGFRLMEWLVPGGANNLLSTAAAWTNDTSMVITTNAPGFTEGDTYKLVIQITRTAGGADIYEAITNLSNPTLGSNGVLEVSFSDTTPQPLVFDTFALRPSTPEVTATNFDTTLFKVEFTAAGCAPTPFNVTGTTNFCPGGTGPVGLSGSDTGVDYHLRLGGVPTGGSPVAGTGGAISFGPQGAGTYTVYASNTTIDCQGLMTGSAILALNAAPTITVQPSPVDATNSVGDSRTFGVTVTGTGPFFYQWRTNGVNVSNGGNISGATSNAIIIANMTAANAGAYDVVVNGTCSPPTTSQVANLTVLTTPGNQFRSLVANGLWEDANSWEQSSNGVTWFAADAPPTSTASNITVLTGHTITLNADATVDQVTVQAGATVQLANGNLIINNGPGVDFNVAGTIEMVSGGGGITVGSSTLQFQNGSQFKWNRASGPAIPSATWQDGSTCRIGDTTAATATGISGQSFYDFVFDSTFAGSPGVRCRFDINGTNTTIRHDFSITLPDVASASVTINNGTNSVLTVGRDVVFVTGASDTSTKVLLNNASAVNYVLKVGRNFSSTGNLDGFGGASAVIEFTGAGTHSLALPIQPNLITSGAMNWVVDSGSTVQLASQIDGFNSFTNNGTLTFGANQIIRGSTLAFNTGGVVNGNGTNLIATNVNTLVAGGTINLGTLPSFAGGETFKFIDATTYTGTFGTLLPATPDGTHVWNVSQLNTAATLTVANAPSGPATNPTNIVSSFGGGNVTLSWPTDHTGWTLQTQTNSRSVGLTPATNTWFDVSGSTTTNLLVIPVGQNNPTVFYRLKLFVP